MVYYVNYDRIRANQKFLFELGDMAEALLQEWEDGNRIYGLAQERILHLAIEAVTDIGSLLIDGFMMRDASSYEDIIEILRGEEAIDGPTAERLVELVRERKKLVQDYVQIDRVSLHPALELLPQLLRAFSEQVDEFIERQPLK